MTTHKTNLSHPKNIIYIWALANQIDEEIRKMLQEWAMTKATIDLERALACFKVDWQGTIKKIQDVNCDPLPATSTSEVKIDRTPPRRGMTRDEFTVMLTTHASLVKIQVQRILSSLWIVMKKRGNEIFIFYFSSWCFC